MARDPRENWTDSLPSNPDKYDRDLVLRTAEAMEKKHENDTVFSVIAAAGALILGLIMGSKK